MIDIRKIHLYNLSISGLADMWVTTRDRYQSFYVRKPDKNVDRLGEAQAVF